MFQNPLEIIQNKKISEKMIMLNIIVIETLYENIFVKKTLLLEVITKENK